MAHHNKKKLSLSERFGTIGYGTNYHIEAINNSEIVGKLQKQITEVMMKRTGEYDRESQAKMISDEISDIQQRFDDAPVASLKFKPFKVELKVNISNRNAEQQMNIKRNGTACNARNTTESCHPPSYKTDQNEKRQRHGIGVASKHISDSEYNLMKKCQSKNNETNMTATSSTKDELRINLQETSVKFGSDEGDVNNLSSPKVHQDTPSDTHQPCDGELNSQNTAKALPAFQEGWEIIPSKKNQQEADFNKTNRGNQPISNINNGCAQSSQNIRKGSKASQDFKKKTSPNFNKRQASKTSPNINRGQGSKTSPNFNKGLGIQTSQNFNTHQDCKESPNLNKEKSFQTSLDLNKSNNALVSENFSKGQGSKRSESLCNAPNFSRRQNFQTKPKNMNNIQTNTSRLCSDVSPNLNKGQGFQVSSNITRGKSFQDSPNFKTVGFQTSPNFKQNVPKSFGPGNLQNGETNVQQSHANTFSTDGSHAMCNIQGPFCNYPKGNWVPKGKQKRVHFQNKTGYEGHPTNQQGSFISNSSHHYHGNQARQSNPETSYKNEQPVGYSPSKQLDTTGGFGKRHASPLPSNQYMAPAKKRVLNSDPLNKDIPSFQNRLSYAEKNMPSNPSWQGNHHVSHSNAYTGNYNHSYGYYPGHVAPSAPPQPSVAGNYGLALHGPFTPKTWNMSNQTFTSTCESTNTNTLDNKFRNLNETSSTKQYLFSKMLGQNDAMRPAEDRLRHTEDAVKPSGVKVKSANENSVQSTGDILKPTGFYQEISNETSGPRQNEKEETELLSTLLTQCQAMAQKDDDRQALNTIFNIIHQEMGHQTFQTSVKNKISSTDHTPEQRSTSDAYDDARFSPTSSSPDAASKLNGNIRFEGRTLLKGGVKPRHIPKTLVNKQDDDPPKDPRPRKDHKPLQSRKMKDLPLPPFFIEFVATEKFGKKKKIEGKTEENAVKNMTEESRSFIPSSEIKTKDVQIDIGKVDSLSLISNNGIEQQQTAHGGLVSDTKTQDCDTDGLERRKTEVISPILPLITLRQEPGLNETDNTCIGIFPRDPRLRATSISKKRENNPIVDLPVLKYEKNSVEKCEPPDNVCEKVQECVAEPKRTQCGDFKEQNEAYLLTNVKREGPKSLQRNSPSFHRDTREGETNIPRSVCERISQCHSDSKNSVKQSSEKLPSQQRRYCSSYSTNEVDKSSGSLSRRWSRFSSEHSLSSSRSKDEVLTEKKVAVRRADRVNISHGNVHQTNSYDRDTFVYKDGHRECYKNQFHEKHEYDGRSSERRSMSPGTCRYLKRRDMERKNTPPSSINRNAYRNRYQGRRNRNYSEGSDYPESCSSPLR